MMVVRLARGPGLAMPGGLRWIWFDGVECLLLVLRAIIHPLLSRGGPEFD